MSNHILPVILEKNHNVFSLILIFSWFLLMKILVRRRQIWEGFTYLKHWIPLICSQLDLEFSWPFGSHD